MAMATVGMEKKSVERQAYKLAEVLAALPIGRTKLHEEVASGRLKTFRIGRAVFVHRDDFENWLAKYRGNAA